MVFYRKYRPQILHDLDSTLVRETLTKVLSKSVPHAMLFTGPKGLGKTSTARIVAKVVNCTGKDTTAVEPCNTCEQCVSITNNTNLDVMEIDAASNRGIDEIRELKDKIRLAPLAASKKVYIIDEVHMLTTEAFNALLKTLEEPPSHAMFMLCTTEPQKVPATILSRCFHVTFKPATKEELVRSLKRIATGEKIDIDDTALMTIADLSEGGFRDAAKMLEEISAVTDETKITKDMVDKKLHVSGVDHYLTQLVGLIGNRETKLSLTLISELVTQGMNMQFFTEQLLATFHAILLGKTGVKKLDGSYEKLPLTLQDLKHILQLLTKAYIDMKTAVIPQLPLELAIIEWGEGNNKVEKAVIEDTVVAKKTTSKKDETVSVTTLRREVGNIAKIKALYGEKHVADQIPEKPTVKTASVELLKYASEGELTDEWMETFWRCIISEMKSHNHTVAGVLRGCVLKSFDRKNLIIETPFKFHKDKLEDGKNRDALETICKELVGKPVSISIVLKSN